MVKVCDSIMGAGKTSASITYINEHPDNRFIYITPYLEEAKRIKEGCPESRFVEPNRISKENGHSKIGHTAQLIKNSRNITTTHQAFTHYTDEMIEDIRSKHYCLIIDENLTVMETYDIRTDDLYMAVDAGYIKKDNGVFHLTDKHYNGVWFSEIFKFMKHRDLIQIDDENGLHMYYWVLPPELIAAFDEVIVLTYLFEGQGLHHFFNISNIDYEYIGVEKRDDGTFTFGEYPGYIPDYVYDLKKKVHIVKNDRLNKIGREKYALSKNWFREEKGDLATLRNNLKNYFTHYTTRDAGKRMVGQFTDYSECLKGKGYTRAFTTFNMKSTNKYRDRKYLAYIPNLFMNVGEKLFYNHYGVECSDDLYALSIMIQWIWRSAIRDGNDVIVYIPSNRMRNLLIDWMDSFDNREVTA